jgi:hypothetical protein
MSYDVLSQTPTPALFWDSTESRCYASDVQRGALSLLWFGKREKITEKFHRACAALLGTTLVLRLLSLSLLSIAMDGGSLI